MDKIMALAAAAALATSMASPVMAGGYGQTAVEQTPVPAVVPEEVDDAGAFAAAASIPGLAGGAGTAAVVGGLALAAIVAAAAGAADASSATGTR